MIKVNIIILGKIQCEYINKAYFINRSGNIPIRVRDIDFKCFEIDRFFSQRGTSIKSSYFNLKYPSKEMEAFMKRLGNFYKVA